MQVATADIPARTVSPASLRMGQWLQRRGGLVALGLLVLVAIALPTNRGADVFGVGMVNGGVLALHAMGLVLVYRANGIINIAQVQMGLLGGVLLAEFSTRRQFLVWLNDVCESCVASAEDGFTPVFGAGADELTSSQVDAAAADGWLVHVNYALSLVVPLTVVGLVTFAVYHFVVKRFARSSRLILTLVSIGLSGLFLQLALILPSTFGGGDVRQAQAPPFEVTATFGGTVFHTVDALKLAVPVLVVILIGSYFRHGTTGRALRAAADNPSRAETLGIPVARITARVWVIAGLLSGLAAMLQASAVGIQPGGAWSTLVRALAVAVVARFLSLPLAVVAAAVVAVFDQTVLRVWGSAHLTDGVLLLVILVLLYLAQDRSQRADTEDVSWGAAREIRPTPQELRDLPEVRSWRRRLIALGAVVGVVLPWLLSPSQTTRVSVAAVYAIIALSLLVLTGWAGQISLGQAAFAAVGAWVSASMGGPLLIRLVAAGLAGAVVAVLLGLPALRMRGMHLAVATLAFAVAVPAVLLNPSQFGSALPSRVDRPIILGLDLADQRSFYYAVLIAVALTIAAVMGMRRSRTARALIACRDNDAAAQSFGINLLLARVSAFAIAGFMSALAGVLLSWANFGVHANSYSPEVSVEIFLVAVVGGLGSVVGPLIGAAWFGVMLVFDSEFIRYFTSLGLGVTVIIVLLFLPGGLGEAVFGLRDAVLRQIAERRGIDVPSLTADRRAGDRSGRAPILPKERAGGGRVFVPFHYRLDGNWVVKGSAGPGDRQVAAHD